MGNIEVELGEGRGKRQEKVHKVKEENCGDRKPYDQLISACLITSLGR